MTADGLVVGGLTPFTTIDVPGRLAAVVFCQGCAWRCAYCHNRHLLARRAEQPKPWSEIRAFLERRRGWLDAVAFSGGEPLLQTALGDAVTEIKAMGFAAALHTGGPHPRRFARLLPGLDWVGFDVKARFADYARVTGIAGSGAPARESLKLLLASGVAHEVRTTVDDGLMGRDDLRRMADELAALGVGIWVLQEGRPALEPFDDPDFLADLAARFAAFQVRRANPAA